MFSGIVEELGTVTANAIAARGRLRLAAPTLPARLHRGESVAVNGCCLTVTAVEAGELTADVMPETARRTTLGELGAGDAVNLEAALAYGERVGGHLLSGHVDATGEVLRRREEGNAVWVTVAAPEPLTRYLVPKGCVAVDGISLTVVEVDESGFSVALIPHTVAATTARRWRAGTRVNLEADLLAKYVERALAGGVAAIPGAA